MSIRIGSTIARQVAALLRTWAAEPVVQFAVVAGIVFGFHAGFARPDKPVIVIDEAVIDSLMRSRAAVTLRPLTEDDRQGIIEARVQEEVLLREAERRGLSRTPRLRGLLIELASHVLVPEAPPPDAAGLRRFYEEHRELFAQPAVVSFQHVMIASGAAVPPDLIDRLRAGADPASLSAFDMAAGPMIGRVDAAHLAAVFGASVATRILAIADDDWHGPLSSSRGQHFVRVTELIAARTPSFEEMERYLPEEWERFHRERALGEAVRQLSAGYRIVRPR